MNTALLILLALNVCAILLAAIRANNRRIEEQRFWEEYYATVGEDWAPR